jgi:hypothetical protein
MLTKGFTALLVVGLLSSLASACDRFPARDRLGVTVDSAGVVTVLYFVCSGESVGQISVVMPRGSPGGGDDTVLFQVTSQSSSIPGVLSVGVGEPPPPGFVTSVPLQQPLPQSGLSAFASTSAASGVAQGFDGTDLAPGQVRNGKDLLSQSAFEERASGSCAD